MLTTGCQRIVRGTAATIEWQPVDQYGDPSDPDAAVTATVVRADGSTVKAAGTATNGSGDAPRTVALTTAETVQLDVLTATWTIDGVDVGESRHEIVGRRYMSTADLRAIESSLGGSGSNPATVLRRAVDEIETMFEHVCRRAFVPRFTVVPLVNGHAPMRHTRAVRWARTVNTDGTYTTIVSPQLAIDPGGVYLVASNAVTAAGATGHRVEIGVEHGLDAPPFDLARAAASAVRRQVNLARSGIDPRAMSYTGPSGEVQRFPTPGLGPWVTGVPEIDEVLRRYQAKALPSSFTVGNRRDGRYPMLRVN